MECHAHHMCVVAAACGVALYIPSISSVFSDAFALDFSASPEGGCLAAKFLSKLPDE
jgi:hypothetical protein